MKFTVITLFPEFIEKGLSYGVVGQAFRKSLFEAKIINPRDWATDLHRSVDDRPFGGGDGMVMKPDVLDTCLKAQNFSSTTRVLYMSPQGRRLDEAKVQELVNTCDELVLISGRYGGIDERFLNRWVDEEISVGDYVLSGGELPALVLIDALLRKISGVLGNEDSSSKDSFAEGLLEAPLFTRPSEWEGEGIPETLRSGHHGRIAEWKQQMALLVTWKKRPDLFPDLGTEDLKRLELFYEKLPELEKKLCGVDDKNLFEKLFYRQGKPAHDFQSPS